MQRIGTNYKSIYVCKFILDEQNKTKGTHGVFPFILDENDTEE